MSGYLRLSSLPDYPSTIPIFSLGYYIPLSEGKDEFSKNILWFHKYGSGANKIKNIFIEFCKGIFEKDNINWDIITVIPSHFKGGVNQNLITLAKSFSEKIGGEYIQIFERKKEVPMSHSGVSYQEREQLIHDSLNYLDIFENKNVLMIDNTSITGISMVYCGNILKKYGANKVAGICLGFTKSTPNPNCGMETDICLNSDSKASDYLKLLNIKNLQ